METISLIFMYLNNRPSTIDKRYCHCSRTSRKKCLAILLLCFFALPTIAQVDLTMKRNDIYVESPILAKGENNSEQTTFAAMHAPLIKKVNENPKVLSVDYKNCAHKLLTIIQNYRRHSYRDSTNGKFYYKVEFQYTIAVKNTQKNEVLAQGMTKKGSAQSEKSYADALSIACKTLPYESDINEVVEEAFALVGLITNVEPDPKKPKRAGNVYIDLGTNHGIRKNQWFDVFIVNNGEVSDRIATIHLDKAGETTSVCKAKKDKEQLLSLWQNNNGAKFAVVSRMESNIFKKLEKALDFVTNIIDAY